MEKNELSHMLKKRDIYQSGIVAEELAVKKHVTTNPHKRESNAKKAHTHTHTKRGNTISY